MTNATNWYTADFKAWQKQAGARPTAEQLQAIHDLGLRPGKQALACAMGLRDSGVTGAQIVLACGAPQLNRMRGLILDKLVRRVPVSRDERNHTVYKLELTEKGKQRIAGAQKRAAADEAAGGVEPAIAAKRAATGAKPAKASKAKPEVAKVLAKAIVKTAKAQRKAERKAAVKAAMAAKAPALAVDDNGNVVAISPSAELLPANVLIDESTHNDIDAGTFTDETE